MIRIRQMNDTDVISAGELEALVFSMPWKSDDFLEMIKATYAHYYVAEEDGKIIGICGLRQIGDDAEISNMAVHPDKRREHIGLRLLTEALKKSESLGIKNVTLEVRRSNTPAIRLYEFMGFKEEGIRPGFYDDPKEDALIMWRRI